jgi:peptidoglycan hydrolase CwlO-like protein
MKSLVKGALIMLLLASSLVFIVSCGPVPYCDTSLVTLDETRLELVTYEEESARTGENVEKLETDLGEVQEQIAEIESKPEELKKKIHELKKGSGRE